MKYDDIINMPHHVSDKRPHMDEMNRAAQFAPFAALTGFDAAIQETGRLTDSKIELTENMKSELDGKLQYISQHLHENLEITLTYYVPDLVKEGGKYIVRTGKVKKLDSKDLYLRLENDELIKFEDIYEINHIVNNP